MLKIGYSYSDLKFDNFTYRLSDTPREHLNIKMRNNTINTVDGIKYFYVYLIDWDSGLNNFEKRTELDLKIYKTEKSWNKEVESERKYITEKIISKYNENCKSYSIFGQYQISYALDLLIRGSNEDVEKIIKLLKLPNNIVKIIKKEYDMKTESIPELKRIESIEEIEKKIKSEI